MNRTLNQGRQTVIMACAAFIAVVLMAGFMGVGRAWAGGGAAIDVLENNKNLTVSYLPSGDDIKQRVYGATDYKKVSNVKSSNTKVATVELLANKQTIVYTNGECDVKILYSIAVKLKKPGTTKISFKHGTKKYTVNYTVKKYASPVASFKIGSKDYTSAFKPSKLSMDARGSASTYVTTASGKLSGKMTVKLAKGFKVSSIYASQNGKYGKVKNKATLKKATTLQMLFKNAKTGELVEYYFTPMTKAALKQLKAAK